jgi:hypothetical protein
MLLSVTASPALADGRGGGWQLIPVPPTFTVEPVVCGFEIQGTLLVGKEFVTRHSRPRTGPWSP